MRRAPRPAVVVVVVTVVAVVAAVALAGCPGTRGAGPHLGGPEGEGPPPPPVQVIHEDRTITVAVGDQEAHLGALLAHPDVFRTASGKGPAVLIVPGSSDISRKGTRAGDGVTRYQEPVDVSLAWADALAARGMNVLTWDKRTCGPNDDPLCAKNPQDDIDAEGPGALEKDVDAACALVKDEPGFDGRIVLFAHAQAAQVALASTCAKEAAAIVLAAPIPRAIDDVIVEGLKARTRQAERAARSAKDPAQKATLLEEANQLKNLAGTRQAELRSIKAGRFAPTARVQGATIAFWKGWMDLTGRTAALVDAVPAPKVVVLGDKDVQYGDKDRVRIRALAPDAFIEVKGADHHLLTDGKLAASTVDLVAGALDRILQPQG